MLKNDSFFTGILYGLVFFTFSYGLLSGLNYCWTELLGKYNYLPSPKLELLALLFNLIFFRFMIVKWKRIETGKGIFMVIAISVAVYVLLKRVHL